jgi:hypothetical protein
MAKKRARAKKAKRPRAQKAANESEVLLKKILITQLAIAGVGQREIARIVGMSLGAVNPIARHVKFSRRTRD